MWPGRSEATVEGRTVDKDEMLAVRWHARGDVRLETIPRPSAPAPGRVTVRVEAAGICGTDLEEWQDGPINVAVAPHPLLGTSAPLVLGHEFCGEIVAAGEGSGLEVGQRVAVEVNTSCGRCTRCEAGETQQCASLASLGLHGDGGLAELVDVPAATCVVVPEHLDRLVVVLAEPLAVGVRALRRTGAVAGEHVAVLGGGAVGQLVARLAADRGMQVTLVERLESRRRTAELAGITSVAPGAVDATLARTPDGLGYDVVLECAGFAGAVRAATQLGRPGARIAVLGVSTSMLDISPWELVSREQSLFGILSHTQVDFAEALAALADGRVPTEGIVTDVVPLADALEGAFEPLLREPGEHLKVVVVP